MGESSHRTARSADHNSWWSGHSHHHSGSWTRDSGWTTHTRHSSGFKTSTVAITPVQPVSRQTETRIIPVPTIGRESAGNIVTEIVPWWSTIRAPPLATDFEASIITIASESGTTTQIQVSFQGDPGRAGQVLTIATTESSHSPSNPSVSGLSPSVEPQKTQYSPAVSQESIHSANTFQTPSSSPNPSNPPIESAITSQPIAPLPLSPSPFPASTAKATTTSTLQTIPILTPPTTNTSNAHSNPTLPAPAKIGLALGILFLILLITSALLYRRHRTHHSSSNPPYHSLPTTDSPSPSPSPSLTQTPPLPLPTSTCTSNTHHSSPKPQETQQVRIPPTARKDSTPLIVKIIAGEGKGWVDGRGIRWPERVVLRGEAREVWEWGGGYREVGGWEEGKEREREGRGLF